MKKKRMSVFVDGFNLYYAIRNSGEKWLNLVQLSQLLFKDFQIDHVQYFTAKIKSRRSDPTQHIRQQTYFRALRTLPEITIHFGHFLTHTVKMPDASNPAIIRDVIKTEEKGSDVNLAVHLLNDAHKDKFDVAAVISNDSDLAEPIKLAINECGKEVFFVTVDKTVNKRIRESKQLQKVSSKQFRIRQGLLKASQFPQEISDRNGTIHKPNSW